jgi:hypothetical protein
MSSFPAFKILRKDEIDFARTMESLRVAYLVYCQSGGDQQTTVYAWISALKGADCQDSFKKMCLRNQMALDLLQQLERRTVEWPFDQTQARTRL